jgi:acetylornithine/succinyldiaminopimelate/putrescine aminotransferase
MTVVMDDVVARESRQFCNLQAQRVTLVRGEGVRLFDANGREYYDLLSGIGVAALGHAHPALARAVADQAKTLIHTSNLFFHPLQGQLAERLASLSGLPRAFFCNSGTEAVRGVPEVRAPLLVHEGEPRQEFIALDESFHGRTFGSLSVTSDEHYRSRSSRSADGQVRADQRSGGARRRCRRRRRRSSPSGDRRRRRSAADAGVRGGDQGGVREDRRAAHRRRDPERPRPHRLPFYFQALGLEPHLVASARRSAAACRSARRWSASRSRTRSRSAITARPTAATCSPAARRSASSARSSTAASARTSSASARIFEQRLRAMARAGIAREGSPRRGLMWGLELSRDAAPVVPAALERGVIVNRTAETVVRLLPPLVITETEVDEALGRLDAALGAVGAGE